MLRIQNKIRNKLKAFNKLYDQRGNRYNFVQNEDQYVIDIFEEIDDWWGYGLNHMNKDLAKAGNKDVLVRVHSPGGYVVDGIGIANLLKTHRGNVETCGIGWVASIATYILISGDKSTMCEDAYFMIHNPWGGTIGEAKDLESYAITLRDMEDMLANAYLRKIKSNGKLIGGSEKKTLTQIKKWMNEETWFTAQKAFEVGFIDEVVATQFDDIKMYNCAKGTIDKFNKLPDGILNFINKSENNSKMNKIKEFFQKGKETITWYNSLVAALSALFGTDIAKDTAPNDLLDKVKEFEDYEDMKNKLEKATEKLQEAVSAIEKSNKNQSKLEQMIAKLAKGEDIEIEEQEEDEDKDDFEKLMDSLSSAINKSNGKVKASNKKVAKAKKIEDDDDGEGEGIPESKSVKNFKQQASQSKGGFLRPGNNSNKKEEK